MGFRGQSSKPRGDIKTKVFEEEYNGRINFAVWEVDDFGDKVGEYPVASFGYKKAQTILKHSEELKAFVNKWKR